MVVCRPTVSATGDWGEKCWETENCHSTEQLQKTRRVPAVRCTLCWAALQLLLEKHYHNSPSRHSADKGKVRSRGGVLGNDKIIICISGVEIKPSFVRMKSGPCQKTQPNFSYNMGSAGHKPPN